MKCYIFDLDGTLADDSHRAHHIASGTKDWDAYYAACPYDKPIEHVIALATALQKNGYAIVIVTGRSETVRAETERWLMQQGVMFSELIMRKKGDFRKNSEVKIAALHDLRAKGYFPLMGFDDLQAAVDVWRAAGLPCAHVSGTHWSEEHSHP